MDFNKEFYSLLVEIANGLESKQKEYIKFYSDKSNISTRYIKDQRLMKAINRHFIFALKYKLVDKNGEILAPKDETDAILNYYSKSIEDWTKGWQNQYVNYRKELIDIGPLVTLREGNCKYICTDECEELSQECYIYDTDLEQKRLYKELRKIGQLEYVYVRKFIIQNPIIDSSKLREFENKLKEYNVQQSKIEKIKEYAYESIPSDATAICGNCGWTVSSSIDGIKKCIDYRCKKNTNNFNNIRDIGDTRNKMRLCPGVMKYMCIPGKLELDIEKYCIENNIEYELWPNKDTYDIKICKDDKVIAIDAKDYKNAFVLKNKILEDNVLPHWYDFYRSYIVVPNESIENKVDYCEVINKVFKMKKQDILCITYSQLIKKLREEI